MVHCRTLVLAPITAANRLPRRGKPEPLLQQCTVSLPKADARWPLGSERLSLDPYVETEMLIWKQTATTAEGMDMRRNADSVELEEAARVTPLEGSVDANKGMTPTDEPPALD